MGMRLFSAPAEPGGMEAPPLPPELTRALGLPSDASVIDAVDAIDQDAAASTLRKASRRGSSRPAGAEVVPAGTTDRGEALSGVGGHGSRPRGQSVRSTRRRASRPDRVGPPSGSTSRAAG